MKRPALLLTFLKRADALQRAVIFALLASMSAALLTGCSCSDDPRGGGYLCGREGSNSGAYQDRVDGRKKQVDDVSDENLRKQQDVNDLTMHNEDLGKQADQISNDLFQLESETAALQEKIATASANSTGDKKELARLEREVGQVKDQVALAQNTPGTDDERRRELTRLQQKYKDLQNQILLLTGGI